NCSTWNIRSGGAPEISAARTTAASPLNFLPALPGAGGQQVPSLPPLPNVRDATVTSALRRMVRGPITTCSRASPNDDLTHSGDPRRHRTATRSPASGTLIHDAPPEPVALPLPRAVHRQLRPLLRLPRRPKPGHELPARRRDAAGPPRRPRQLRLRRGRPAPVAGAAQHPPVHGALPRRADSR